MIFPSTSLCSLSAAAVLVVSSSSVVHFGAHGFQPISWRSTTRQQQQQQSQPLVSSSSGRPLTVMYRIRCENKYYQLEELEDAENCTTELFLKEDGTVDILETDGPLFTKALGSWEVSENHFVMSITKTFSTGTDNPKDATGMGEFEFQVERVFEGDLTVVGGTEVAINGKILAEDIITDKMDKEVGFFNMIDGTDVRLERRPDARPKNIGVIPSKIDSHDVKGHDGIPKEWLEPVPQVVAASAAAPTNYGGISEYGGGSFGQDAQGYGGGGNGNYYGQQQQQSSAWGSGSEGSGYTQAAPTPQQPGINEYGGGSFGQESQAYGGGGYGQQQQPAHGSADPGPPSFSDWGQETYTESSSSSSYQESPPSSPYDDYYQQGDYNGSGGISPM